MLEHSAGLLLAAGLASRMDHRPKALLLRDGVSLVRRNALALLRLGVKDVVVVVGHHATALTQALVGLPVKIVHNLQPEAGQAQSLQLGLKSLDIDCQAVVIALADMPLLEAADVQQVWHAFESRPAGADFVQPVRGDEVGNPVVIAARLFHEWRASSSPMLGKAWQQRNPSRVHHWPSPNPHFFVDLDTPEDLLKLQTQHGIQLDWPPAS